MLNPTDPARNNEVHLPRAHEIAGAPSRIVRPSLPDQMASGLHAMKTFAHLLHLRA